VQNPFTMPPMPQMRAPFGPQGPSPMMQGMPGMMPGMMQMPPMPGPMTPPINPGAPPPGPQADPMSGMNQNGPMGGLLLQLLMQQKGQSGILGALAGGLPGMMGQ
jgi:hypothetical protein